MIQRKMIGGEEIWRRGWEDRSREMTSFSPRLPPSSPVSGGFLAWLIAFDSRDLHHDRNPISHLSQLPIATWAPIQECDSNMSGVFCISAVVLPPVVT